MRWLGIFLVSVLLNLVYALVVHALSGHVNYRVPKEAIESAELVDCDYSKPPNCRAVNLVYKSGSEIMVVNTK